MQIDPVIASDSEAIQKKIPEHHLNLGNFYLNQLDFNKAKQHIYQALRLNPNYAEAYNNLGRLFYKQQLFTQALSYFQKALRLDPNYFEAHYNLGHTFSQLNQFDQAYDHYRIAVNLQPDHAAAQNNLGLILFEAEKYSDACPHLEKAAELQPNDIPIRLFLGQTYLALGKTNEAKTLYQSLLTRDDSLAEAHHNLAVLFLWEKNNQAALQHFQKALEYQPGNETAAHMIAALQGEITAEQPSETYVRDLFDQYADYYNSHVKEKLAYQAPYLLRDAIARCLKHKLKVGRILDLGCGTGLCALYFRDLARELIGVDVSPKMLAKAKQLPDAYDELITQEIITYLEKFSDPIPDDKKFNYILASDVLVYFSDLSALFKNLARHLTSEGYFLFTTEISDTENFALQPTGRFAHHPNYIKKMAENFGFTISLEEKVLLRKNDNDMIYGYLYILQKNI